MGGMPAAHRSHLFEFAARSPVRMSRWLVNRGAGPSHGLVAGATALADDGQLAAGVAEPSLDCQVRVTLDIVPLVAMRGMIVLVEPTSL